MNTCSRVVLNGSKSELSAENVKMNRVSMSVAFTVTADKTPPVDAGRTCSVRHPSEDQRRMTDKQEKPTRLCFAVSAAAAALNAPAAPQGAPLFFFFFFDGNVAVFCRLNQNGGKKLDCSNTQKVLYCIFLSSHFFNDAN